MTAERDSHEQYPYRFANQQTTTPTAELPAGDYGVVLDGRLVAAVERRSLPDLVSSLTSGKLGYQLADLASLPRARVAVEDRYSQVFKLDRVRPAIVADGLAELAVRGPGVPGVFCETRGLAEEWTYRYLAAAHQWATSEDVPATRIGVPIGEIDAAPAAGGRLSVWIGGGFGLSWRPRHRWRLGRRICWFGRPGAPRSSRSR